MKFLSDILAKAGLTVDGVVTLNNTATGQTPASNDNSTKLATTAWVRTFVQPYSLPIASTSILGGIKVGTGLSIDAGSGILSVTGGGAASIKSTQTFTATGGQTVFTITGGYIVGLIDVFLNGVYLSPNQTTATNGTSITLGDAALAGDIIDVIIASPVFQGATTTTDQLSEGTTNLYFTNARARAAISETVTGLDYNSSTGVLSITTGYGIPTTASQTTWDAAYNDKINSAAVTGTTTKTLTLTQQDGGTVTATWTDNNTDAVTSVFGRTGVVVAVSGDYTTTLVTEGTNLYYTDARARAAISVTGSGSYNSATGVITVTGGVTSVNTLTGAVVLTTTNIAEGTNLYYTQARFDTAFTAKSTTNLTEGTNLYYTSARANADFDTRLATKSTSNLSEGTNLYYTDARVGTYLTTNSYATQTYVGTQIANLVAAAPATLDTLNELAVALGNDPNFATTVATSIGTKVPQTRTITINGTTFDLSANRTYTINSMVYPGAGIALSTGTAWGTSITDNSANWNTAFGWGNHASGGYLTTALAATTYASLTGAYANPAFVASLAYSKITGVPAFLTSYTETDTLATVTARGATTSTETIFTGTLKTRKSQTAGDYQTAALWTESFSNTATGIAFHISGVKGTFLEMRTNSVLYWDGYTVYHSGNLTNLNQLTNGPGYITGYTETDTLATVTGRGASTSTAILINNSLSVNGGTVNLTTYTSSEARIADSSIHLMKTSAAGIFEAVRAMNADTTIGTTVRLVAAATSDPFNNTNGGKVFIDAVRTATNMDLVFSLNDVGGAAPVERVRFTGGGNATIYGNLAVGNSAEVLGLIQMGSGGRYGMGVSGAYTNVYGHNFGSGVRLGSYDGTTFTPVLTAANGGAVTITGALSASNFSGTHSGASSGTNTGDQTNISGNAATATSTPLVTIDNSVVYGRSGLQFAQSYGTAGNTASNHNTPTGDWWHVIRMNHANGAGYYADLAVSMTSNLGLSRRVISNGAQLSNWVTILDALNYNSYSPSLTGTGASGTWGINVTGTAGSLSNMNISQFTNNSGYITGYTETDTLATVTGRGSTTTAAITVTASEGREVAVYMPSSYTTDDLVSGHEYGWYNDHWRLGMTRSGGAAGADFVIQWNAARRLSLTSGGNLSVTGTIGATNFSGTHSGSSSGTNTGDQTIPTNNNQLTNGAGYITSSSLTAYLPLAGGTMSGTIGFTNVVGNKIDFYYSGDDRYGIQVQNSELRIHSGAQGASSGGITLGKSTGSTFTEHLRIRNDGIIQAASYLRTAGVTSNAVSFSAGTNSVDFGNALGQGSSSRSTFFRGNTNNVSVWWGGIDGNGNNIPYGAIDATAGSFTFWRNSGGTGGGDWTNIMTMNASGLTMNSGNFIGTLTGNAATATTATNLSGLGTIQSTSVGTSYQNNYQIRENSGGSGNTNEIYAPQLGFHWGGVVASSIMMESSGRIAIRNNPGGSYENFVANVIYANSSFQGNLTGNVTGNVSGTALNITAHTINQSVGTGNSPSFAGLTINTGGVSGWGPFVVNSTSLWGDGGTLYATIGAGGAAGIMFYNPHVVWNTGNGCAAIRIGRSGGTSAGKYYEIGTGASDNFFIAKESLSSGTQLNINSSGNATFSGTVTASNLSGTNTGDQTNISGNAATASSVAWSNVSSKPAGWLNETNLIMDNAPVTAVPSGFYQNYNGSGNPTGTWFNYINVRHSNPANGHGFQIGMSYYDTNLWFRSYQGGLSPTYSAWGYAISSLNIASQSVSYATTAGSATDSTKLPLTGGNLSGHLNFSQPVGLIFANGQYIRDNGGGGLVIYSGNAININSTGVSVNNNVKINPVSESWAEGLTFMMPSTSTWGGLRWQRQRGGYDGNWAIGYTALDATDDLVFIANNGGAQINNILRLTKVGNVSTSGSFTASGDITAYSDIRIKENILTIDNALEKTLALRGVYYNRTDKDDKSQKVGVIAQEIQQVLPQVVQEQTDGMLSVSYGNMAGLFIEAIKEQQTQIESQKSEIDVLKDLVQQLINR